MVRRIGFYEKYIKRYLDVFISIVVLIILSWLYVLIAILVKAKLGSPVVFKQIRPGMIDTNSGQERLFCIYKFRSMSSEKDKKGRVLPDKDRTDSFGTALRRTSLDELLEMINILKGEMSIVGPRPQLVKDMVFMSDRQRMRHIVRPGLTGLAQVMGRNAISWEDKLELDLKYVENVSFKTDLGIVLRTVKKLVLRQESLEELDSSLDFGDALLKDKTISKEEYDALQERAESLIAEFRGHDC